MSKATVCLERTRLLRRCLFTGVLTYSDYFFFDLLKYLGAALSMRCFKYFGVSFL